MRKKLLLVYIIVLGIIGIFATEPVLPQSKPNPNLPPIYLYGCLYNSRGVLVGYVCSEEYSPFECNLINCE
jgi:hypothetical protein